MLSCTVQYSILFFIFFIWFRGVQKLITVPVESWTIYLFQGLGSGAVGVATATLTVAAPMPSKCDLTAPCKRALVCLSSSFLPHYSPLSCVKSRLLSSSLWRTEGFWVPSWRRLKSKVGSRDNKRQQKSTSKLIPCRKWHHMQHTSSFKFHDSIFQAHGSLNLIMQGLRKNQNGEKWTKHQDILNTWIGRPSDLSHLSWFLIWVILFFVWLKSKP